MDPPVECSVCIEKFTSRNKPVECPYCNKNDVCQKCYRTYIVSTPLIAHCMDPQCHGEWSNRFLANNFPKTFVHSEYREHLKQIALDREKSYLPATMPAVERIREQENLKKEIRDLHLQLRPLKDQIREINGQIRILQDQLYNVAPRPQKIDQCVAPCGVPDCRGFIKSGSWKCGACDTKYCSRCWSMKDRNHECKNEDVDALKEIQKTTKACPTCSARIFRIEGCAQMFCTQCRTAFDWNTGEIIRGVIHNPHYYEMMQQMGTVPRNVGDQPCGGLPDLFDIIPANFTIPVSIRRLIITAHQRTGEAARRKPVRDCTDIRIDYIMGNIPSEDVFRQRIFRRERDIAKSRCYNQIIEAYEIMMIERFNNLRENIRQLTERAPRITNRMREKVTQYCIDAYEEMRKITKISNRSFRDDYHYMDFKRCPQITTKGIVDVEISSIEDDEDEE